MGYELREGSPAPEETPRLIRRWRWRCWGIVILVIGALIIISGTTTWIRDGLGKPLTFNESPRRSDVIIVLGSGTRKNGDHLGPQAKQRVMEGVMLERAGWAPEIIMSGGRDKKTGQVEATEMLAYAGTLGFPITDITPEGYSRNTWENAQDSIKIMSTHDWHTAIVVTSPYHTWRACRIFRKQMADVKCIAAPYSLYPANGFVEHIRDTRAVVREYAAIVYNWAKGQL